MLKMLNQTCCSSMKKCHGDGSLIGQGHNHEILNMQSIPGYTVGGSLHFCCDNNVAFTASGELSRSSPRPGDCALPYKSPVISGKVGFLQLISSNGVQADLRVF